MNIKRLIIMQGCSASGKSHIASMIFKNSEHLLVEYCSADNFFMKDGIYKFNASLLGSAHGYCRHKAETAMKNNYDVVIIDNTNTTKKEVEPYFTMAKQYGYFVQVISVSADEELIKKQNDSRKSDRKIPENVIERQKSKIEKIL